MQIFCTLLTLSLFCDSSTYLSKDVTQKTVKVHHSSSKTSKTLRPVHVVVNFKDIKVLEQKLLEKVSSEELYEV